MAPVLLDSSNNESMCFEVSNNTKAGCSSNEWKQSPKPFTSNSFISKKPHFANRRFVPEPEISVPLSASFKVGVFVLFIANTAILSHELGSLADASLDIGKASSHHSLFISRLHKLLNFSRLL